MDDALVERMAEAMSLDQRQRHGISDCAWADDIEMWRTECRARARAALAVAEPAIRADEREACAEEAFNEYLAAENDVETAGQSDVVARLQSEGAANAANRILQAIRARKETRP